MTERRTETKDDPAEGPGTAAGPRVWLTRLEVDGFRNLQRLREDLSPRLNLIQGANASGKTSLLEAVHCLCVGKSFRTRKGRELVQWGRERATVFGRLRRQGETLRLGVGKGRDGSTEIHRDGKKVESAAGIASLAPVQVVGTEAYALVAEGPWLRRRFLDWGVFHVEPGYGALWQRFRHALRQRNALLRSGRLQEAELDYWDGPVGEAGTALTAARRRYLALLADEAARRLRHWFELELEVSLQPGWAGEEDFRAELARQRGRDRDQGFTGRGPHRADLRVRVEGRPAESLSRGQQKAVAVALRMAQVAVLRGQDKGCLVLFDDLAAELDPENRGRVSAFLAEMEVQAFVTATEADAVDVAAWPQRQRFHVEHGRVAPVV